MDGSRGGTASSSMHWKWKLAVEVVGQILTKSSTHLRSMKVPLETGKVGRVQKILEQGIYQICKLLHDKKYRPFITFLHPNFLFESAHQVKVFGKWGRIF